MKARQASLARVAEAQTGSEPHASERLLSSTVGAAWRCLERLEKPIVELEQLAARLGPDHELGSRLAQIQRLVERAAAELREVVG